MKREQELLKQIERMKEDFEQEKHGYILMLRLRDEEISRLKEMLKKEGYWIRTTGQYLPIVCKCSNCGWETAEFDSFNYCANCGTKMKDGYEVGK